MQWLHRNLRGALSTFPSFITQCILGLLSQSGKDGPLSIPAGQQGCSLRSSIVTENKIHVTSQSPKPRAGTESKPPGWVVATHPLQPPASPPGPHSKRQEQSWRGARYSNTECKDLHRQAKHQLLDHELHLGTPWGGGGGDSLSFPAAPITKALQGTSWGIL